MAAQISGIVHHVQSDTGDTMQSLQMLSAHVHSGSELVDRSGRDMRLTEESVNNLVDLIQKIAAAAATQRQISTTIRQRTTAIIENVSRTGAYLLGQAEHTDNLAEQAMALVESVSTYRLPEEHDEPSPQS
jgi:methyl-accepting chemotaxis protein